jgi:hypothetical protein
MLLVYEVVVPEATVGVELDMLFVIVRLELAGSPLLFVTSSPMPLAQRPDETFGSQLQPDGSAPPRCVVLWFVTDPLSEYCS